eukprot:COSAG02_NODE_2449_length_8835_cov_2.885315_6_plen_831_part_00
MNCPGVSDITIPSTKVCDGIHDCPGGEDERCVFECTQPRCAADCDPSMLGNNFCDPECFTPQCNYDDQDCEECREGCFNWLLADGVCNAECANNDCLLDGKYDYSTDPDGILVSDCTTADLAWAQEQLVSALSSLQSIEAAFVLLVQPSYATAVGDTSSSEYVTLSVQLQEGVAVAVGVQVSAVTVYSISSPSGRRHLQQSGRRLSEGSQIEVDYAIQCSACDDLEADLQPDSGNLASSLAAEVVNRAVASAATSGFRGAVISTPQDVVASIAVPVVVQPAADWENSVVCTPPLTDNPTYTLAEGEAPEAWHSLPCMFTNVLDGNCDCQCLSSFADSNPVCYQNDAASGDCNEAEVATCLGSADVCTSKYDPISCESSTSASCAWDDNLGQCGAKSACFGGERRTGDPEPVVLESYQPDQNCEWVVECETDAVTVAFHSLDTEANFDLVYLQDRDLYGTTLAGPFSGQSTPDAITIDISAAFVVAFTSDYDQQGGGFELSYECSGSAATGIGEGPGPGAGGDLDLDDGGDSGAGDLVECSSISDETECSAEGCAWVGSVCEDSGDLGGAGDDLDPDDGGDLGAGDLVECSSIFDETECSAEGCAWVGSVCEDDVGIQVDGRRRVQSSTDGSACIACTAVVGAASVTCTTKTNSRAECSPGYLRTDNSASFSADTCTVISSSCANDYNGGGTAFPSALCTSSGMFIKASLPTGSCASSTCTTSECCDPCDAVANARSITCTAAGNTVPTCKSGYFCQGMAGGGSTCNAQDSCTACSAVDNAESVTCTAAGNSRATCRAGCTKIDNSASGSSDVCVLPSRNCATNWVRCSTT